MKKPNNRSENPKALAPIPHSMEFMLTNDTSTLEDMLLLFIENNFSDESDHSALDAAIALKRMEKALKSVFGNQRVKGILREDYDTESNGVAKKLTRYGATVSNTPVVSYDYSAVGHPRYDAICKIIEGLTAEKKQYETSFKEMAAKNLRAHSSIRNKTESESIIVETIPVVEEQEYGEVVKLNPPIKKQISSLKFSVG